MNTFDFAQWCARLYTNLFYQTGNPDMWCYKHRDPLDEKYWKTTEELCNIYLEQIEYFENVEKVILRHKPADFVSPKQFEIFTELSSHHWSPIDTKDKVVLDLGCGRWDNFDVEESSPAYLGRQAKMIIAVDASQTEIAYFKDTLGIRSAKYIFECKEITSSNEIREYLNKYKPSVLKCDIEGYEVCFYDMTKEHMSFITDFAVEYHSYPILNLMVDKIISWGFKIHTTGRFVFADAPSLGVLFCSK